MITTSSGAKVDTEWKFSLSPLSLYHLIVVWDKTHFHAAFVLDYLLSGLSGNKTMTLSDSKNEFVLLLYAHYLEHLS